MREMQVIVIASLMGILLLACVPKTAQKGSLEGATPIQMAPTAKVNVSQNEESLWENLLAAARKEGRILIYTSAGAIPRQELARSFREKYRIDTEIIVMSGAEAPVKIMAERKAGIYSVDVYVGSSTETLGVMKPNSMLGLLEPVFMSPELVDPEIIKKTWRDGKLLWLDGDHMSLGVLVGVSPSMAINTELVRPGEIKSYRDLLDPKWSGKIVLYDPIRAGSGNLWANMVGWKIMDWDYLRELLKQKPSIISDHRLLGEWLGRGRYSIALAPQSAVLLELRQAGMPIVITSLIEGSYLSVASGSVSLINKAPHPNAAKLFINWLLSKEGGEVFSQAYAKPSNRVDVSKEGIPNEVIPDPNIKYYLADGEEYMLVKPELTKKTTEIFLPYMK